MKYHWEKYIFMLHILGELCREKVEIFIQQPNTTNNNNNKWQWNERKEQQEHERIHNWWSHNTIHGPYDQGKFYHTKWTETSDRFLDQHPFNIAKCQTHHPLLVTINHSPWMIFSGDYLWFGEQLKIMMVYSIIWKRLYLNKNSPLSETLFLPKKKQKSLFASLIQ